MTGGPTRRRVRAREREGGPVATQWAGWARLLRWAATGERTKRAMARADQAEEKEGRQ
jgi:hypothetical protein